MLIGFTEWGSSAALVELLLSGQEIFRIDGDNDDEDDDSGEWETASEDAEEVGTLPSSSVAAVAQDRLRPSSDRVSPGEEPPPATVTAETGSANKNDSMMTTIVELPHNSFRGDFMGPVDRVVGFFYSFFQSSGEA